MGRAAARRATVLNPARTNDEAVPVKAFDVLFGWSVSTGQAASAGARARLAALTAAAIGADATPRPRWPRRT
jgi:hypothetical protein